MKFLNKDLFNGLNLVASLVTLSNFGLSIFDLALPERSSSLPAFPASSLTISIAVFILLEGILAHVFGFLIIRIRELGPGLPLIGMILISLASAWTSIFNVQWIFLQGPPPNMAGSFETFGFQHLTTFLTENFWYLSKFVFFVICAVVMAFYFIGVHSDNRRLAGASFDQVWAVQARRWQAAWFLFLAVLFLGNEF